MPAHSSPSTSRFAKIIKNGFAGAGFYRNTDSHYPLTDCRTYAAGREAVKATD